MFTEIDGTGRAWTDRKNDKKRSQKRLFISDQGGSWYSSELGNVEDGCPSGGLRAC
jgi:hypothetical protein